LIGEWSKIGLHVKQRVEPMGPEFAAMRSGNFDVLLEANCNSVVNPLLDVQKFLPHTVYVGNYGNYEDRAEIDLYQKLLRETDAAKRRVLMRDLEKLVLDNEAHEMVVTYWHIRSKRALEICSDASLIQPDIRQILVQVMARADLPAFHIGAQGNDPMRG